MFGFGRNNASNRRSDKPDGPVVSTKICTDKLRSHYPHVGLYDCREQKVWIAKPLSGQAIRTAHARLITGADNNTSTVWKDRFLCFWLYTPDTGSGEINGYPIDWSEAHLLVRIDPNWDYDRQRLVPPELTDHVDDNLARQSKAGERILRWYIEHKPPFPLSLHLVGQRLVDSRFYLRRIEPKDE
jgi:hypothetical protein